MVKNIGSQMETGTPYMLYKDHVNKKTIRATLELKSSNYTEITEYNSEETVCNLLQLVAKIY